jgi:hypothetical protein
MGHGVIAHGEHMCGLGLTDHKQSKFKWARLFYTRRAGNSSYPLITVVFHLITKSMSKSKLVTRKWFCLINPRGFKETYFVNSSR